MVRTRIIAGILLITGLLIGYFIYASERGGFGGDFAFKLGLDLSGGTHLVYRADVSQIEPTEVSDAMESLRDVIERRVNLFGVSEPIVQVETTAGIISGEREHRLIVELPGVTDVDEATAMIGRTPLLEFRLEAPDSPEKRKALEAIQNAQEALARGEELDPTKLPSEDFLFVPTDLTGRFLERATLVFDQITSEPQVLIDFDKEGSELFAAITRENVGKTLAIYLDGAPISNPVIQEEITGGSAQITGRFTIEEAKQLVGRLNSGALPLPIALLSTQTIGATLGEEARTKGVQAGMWGLLFVSLFMVVWYRLPGIVAVLSLSIYGVVMLSLFKLIPVTITAAGVAGFILSIGMAVDANVIIFERLKEELGRRRGEKNSRGLRDDRKEEDGAHIDIHEAIRTGFSRAWTAIRDANITSIMTAVILFWFGTSLVEGFALVFGLGVLISMITAISVTRTLLLTFSSERAEGAARILFGTGISRPSPSREDHV